MNWNEARGLTWMRCRRCYFRWYCQDRGEAERKDSLEKCPNCADTRFDVYPRDEDSFPPGHRMVATTWGLIVGGVIFVIVLAEAFLR